LIIQYLVSRLLVVFDTQQRIELVMATEKWSEAELDASVKVYLEMLSKESSGTPYKKSAYRNMLLKDALKGRTPGSFEFRMQNISYVLDSLNQPYIKGYLPAKNVGANTKDSIIKSLERNKFIFLMDKDLEPTPDNDQLQERTERVQKIINLKDQPAGQRIPKKTESSTSIYYRDPVVRAWILKNANGKCEACGSDAPFLLPGSVPFLEVHHMIPLASGGPDTIDNTIAVCPNCHRRVHLSQDKDLFVLDIYNKINRLVRPSISSTPT
jgi:5-methylcytosine-specific restriction enzyme A